MMLKNLLKKRGTSFIKKTALTAFSGLMFSSLVAQTTVQIGTSTNTDSNIPLNTNYGFSYSQQIYTASDMNAHGITGPAAISKIRFFLTSGNTGNSSDWVVYLGNSTKTSFTSTTNWEALANLSTHFSGVVTFPGANEWMEITLSTPFNWNGIDNIIVAVDENTSGYHVGGSASWRVSPLGTNRSIYYRNDATNPNPATPPTATGRLGSVNNIQFEVMPTNVCTGAPPMNPIVAVSSNLCLGQNLSLSIQNAPYEAGITYQWQSFDGTNWNDIVGATNSTYSEIGIPASMQFQAVVGCTPSGLNTTLSPISITVNPLPVVTTNIDSVSYCVGNPAIITASGAATYTWLPTAGLNVTNQPTVNATPAAGTTYTVTGTDANGCIATATSYILPAALAPTTITFDPTENCTFGAQVNGTVLGVPADADGGSWTYRFLEADGITEAQPWNSNNVFNFIPTADSVYTFYYQIKNASCANANDSVKFNFTIGFGGDVATVNYDCNNLGGTINVTNTFGQVEINTLYQNAFATAADAAGVAMTGTAAITGGRLVLTPSAGSSTGAASFDGGPQIGANNSMNVSFLMTMDQPINVGADGLAYSFGNDVLTGSAPLQNGRGTKLRLSFDAIDNSTSNGNILGAYLVYGWTNTTNVYGPASAGVLAFNPNASSWFNKTDVPVSLTIDATGKATVVVDGQVIFNNVQMPQAYMDADVSTWKHHFGAQTGGYAFRQAISNFSVTAGTVNYGISQGAPTTEPTSWQQSGVFTNLAPGTYNVWLSKDETTACAKNIEIIEILNTNPIVDLGNDTTICAGESLVLDAGNAGAVYVWSGTQNIAQTYTVNQSGAYVAQVTMPNGCVGIGSVVVNVQNAPSATSIFSQGSYPNYTFSVIGAQNTDSYNWNFGDGTTLSNGPATITHTYSTSGMMNVVATLNNDCGSTDITAQVSVVNDLSISELNIEGLMVYPNPATSIINISLSDASESQVSIYSITGSVVVENLKFTKNTVIDAGNWERGVYFLQISNQGIVKTQRVVVE